MSELAEIVDMLTKIAGTLASIGTLYLLWGKALPKIEQIHVQTNSLTDRLVESTQTIAHAAGVKEGLIQAVTKVAEATAATAQSRNGNGNGVPKT